MLTVFSGFFQLVSTNNTLNIGSKLRLQLFCPPPRAKRQPKVIEVVEWWRRYPRIKYASTLYVTVKGIKLPEHVSELLLLWGSISFLYIPLKKMK